MPWTSLYKHHISDPEVERPWTHLNTKINNFIFLCNTVKYPMLGKVGSMSSSNVLAETRLDIISKRVKVDIYVLCHLVFSFWILTWRCIRVSHWNLIYIFGWQCWISTITICHLFNSFDEKFVQLIACFFELEELHGYYFALKILRILFPVGYKT